MNSILTHPDAHREEKERWQNASLLPDVTSPAVQVSDMDESQDIGHSAVAVGQQKGCDLDEVAVEFRWETD